MHRQPASTQQRDDEFVTIEFHLNHTLADCRPGSTLPPEHLVVPWGKSIRAAGWPSGFGGAKKRSECLSGDCSDSMQNAKAFFENLSTRSDVDVFFGIQALLLSAVAAHPHSLWGSASNSNVVTGVMLSRSPGPTSKIQASLAARKCSWASSLKGSAN